MSGLSFEALAGDGSPRRFVGMHRPPFDTFSGGGYVLCSCGTVLTNFWEGRDHWQMGHLDRPLYDDGQTTIEGAVT